MEELSNQWLNWNEMMLPQLIEAGALTLNFSGRPGR